MTEIRTRIAPSPTGNLHLGTVRTALYNLLFAQKHGGKFLFRLEDTDRERSKQEYTDEIIEGFDKLGITWSGLDVMGQDDQGIIRQSERNEIHQKYIQQLFDQGKAYRCFATPEELDEMRKQQRANKQPEGYDNRGRELSFEKQAELVAEGKKFVVRLNMGETRDIKWKDLVRGEMSVNTKDLGGDPVIQKFNGQILYNFAVVADDADMAVTHVFRGEDHLTNTAKQIAVFEALGLAVPQFGHLPLIFTKDKQKLSKRKHGDIAGIAKYVNEGYLLEALNNYLISTSYTRPGFEVDVKNEAAEIYSLEDVAKDFDVDKISKSPAIYDIGKLNWFNRAYIARLSHTELMTCLNPFLNYDLSKFSENDQELLIDNVRGNLDKFEDINENISYFFDEFEIEEKPAKSLEGADELLKALAAAMQADSFNFDDHAFIKNYINELGAKFELKAKKLFMPIRVAISGRMAGPDLGVIIYLLGKDKALERISKSLSLVAN